MVRTDEDRLHEAGVIGGARSTPSQVIHKTLKSFDMAMLVQTNKAGTFSIWIAREGTIDQIDKALTRANYHKDIDYTRTIGVDYYDVIYTVIKDPTDYNKGMYQYRIKEWTK